MLAVTHAAAMFTAIVALALLCAHVHSMLMRCPANGSTAV